MHYKIGQRLRCEGPQREGRPGVTFIIVGSGDKPNHKRCVVMYDEPYRSTGGPAYADSEDQYSHKHLKEHCTLITDKVRVEFADDELEYIKQSVVNNIHYLESLESGGIISRLDDELLFNLRSIRKKWFSDT